MFREHSGTIVRMRPETIPPKVAKAHRYITRHNPTLADLSRAVGLSRSYLNRKFLRCYGTTPKDLATALQMAEAQRLILGGVPLRRVVTRVGFATQSHFSNRFKQFVGATPTAWLRRQRQQ